MLTNTPHFLDTTNPTTASTTATTTSSSNKVAQAGEFTKNMLAAAHGAGEKLRGEFNQGVDRTFNESEGIAKNERIANAGNSEMATGQFAKSTKNREGAVPGDHDPRRV
ncbi:uncharacterized protein K444DRAFT_661410 [Hyaloscypha bicolor E]|uniref:Uncharacterized protein n=1 Tax=Hyaloscypha bicolor E TaxID=1095630 RepID=A0A2J6TK66_9HELO|nr:uncharacterized protein K444DRAFT_661410 [Hyaloscypha bicolor E]PMD63415.1 hypothetical protein K444DRAFT_661410 [Hyaloscypha bicolor E]